MRWSGIDWSARDHAELCARHAPDNPERLNIAWLCCARHADGRGRVALVETDGERERTVTFDALERIVARFAGGLRALGVGRGDRVAVLLPQRTANIATHLAAFRLGAVSVPLSPSFGADALRHRLCTARVKVVVTERALDAKVLALLDVLPELRAVVSCDRDSAPGTSSFDDIVAQHDGASIVETHRDEPAMVVFTSGTTGAAKGAVHAHRFVPGRLPAFELIHRVESDPSIDGVLWTPADWAWVAGLVDSVLAPLALGRAVLAWARRGRLDPAHAVRVIRRANVSRLFLPPTALRLLARLPDDTFDPPLAIRSVHTAGEPLGAETYAWARARLGEVHELYGLTEVGAVIGCSPFTPVRPGSMGRVFPGYQVDVVDAQSQPVDEGETGEIAVRADCSGMFLEYLDDPAGTAARFFERAGARWMHTGDLARRDADGYFWFAGRADDVFNTAGYRVGPSEIEAAIAAAPEVARVAVVGDPDPERGAVVKAFVVLHDGVAPTDGLAANIASIVRTRVAAYEAPRVIVFARELPETVTGKVRRSALREADADARFGIHRWRHDGGT